MGTRRSARLFLAFRYGLDVLEKHPLRQGAGKIFVHCNVVNPVAEVDAGDDDFVGGLLVLPVAVDGDGLGHGALIAKPPIPPETAAFNACFHQFRSDAGNILTLPWMCPIVVAVMQLCAWRSSLGMLPLVTEAYPLVKLVQLIRMVGAASAR